MFFFKLSVLIEFVYWLFLLDRKYRIMQLIGFYLINTILFDLSDRNKIFMSSYIFIGQIFHRLGIFFRVRCLLYCHGHTPHLLLHAYHLKPKTWPHTHWSHFRRYFSVHTLLWSIPHVLNNVDHWPKKYQLLFILLFEVPKRLKSVAAEKVYVSYYLICFKGSKNSKTVFVPVNHV